MKRTTEKVNVKRYRIKPISDKKAKEKKVLAQMKRDLIDEKGGICSGCGSSAYLDYSHLIPRSKRSDLITHKDNGVLHCRSCHTIFEHGPIEEKMQLLDFWRNLKLIKEMDELYYNRIVSKIQEHEESK